MSPPTPTPVPSPSPGPPPSAPPKVTRDFSLWNPGGHPEKLRAAAEAWRGLARGLRLVQRELGGAAGTLHGGWTGAAADGFQAWQAQLGRDLAANADELDRIAGQLDRVAAEIASTNAQIHELFVAMGVTAAIGLGLAIFTWGFSTAAAADAAVAEGAEAAALVAALSTFLDGLLGRWVIAFAINLTATGIEKAIVNPDHDPLEGWTPGDLAHALLGADALVVSYPIAESIPAYMRLKAARPVITSAVRSGTAGGVAAFGSDLSAHEFEGEPLGWGTLLDVGLSAGVSGLASGVGEWGGARFAARPGRVVAIDPTASEDMPDELNLRVPPPPGLERTEGGLLRSAPPAGMERTESGLLRPAPPAGLERTPSGVLRPTGAGEITVGDRTFTVEDADRIPAGPVEARAPLPTVGGVGPDAWTERPSGLVVPTDDHHSQLGLSVTRPPGNLWQQATELRKAAFKLPVKGLNAGVNGILSPPHPGATHPPVVNPATPGTAPAVPPPPSAPPRVVGGGTYTVRQGDSLWAIADRTYGDGGLWTVLHRANGGIGPDPNLIKPGQVLSIPAVARPAA